MENSIFRVKFAFREAVERKDIAMLKTLLNNHVGAMQTRKVIAEERFDGFTVLQKACLDQDKNIASLFIEYGVDLEQRGKHGWSALHAAAFSAKNDLSLVTLLLNSCSNVVARDDHGCLPVDLAEDPDVRQILLDKMAEKGQFELAEMYRKLDDIKNHQVKVVLECNDEGTCREGKLSRPNTAKAERSLGPNDVKFRPGPTEIASSLGLGYFYTSCEKREHFLSDRPLFRRDRAIGKRRVASWNFKSRRDSGISVDEPDSLTFI